jgi:DNA topoisomerase III
VKRAHFSALTHLDITRALNSLAQPDKNLADAVNVRQEIDLRIGYKYSFILYVFRASFTRMQTLTLREMFATDGVVSYGPCQFPTLGFIVERHQMIRDFVPEEYFTLDCMDEKIHANKKKICKFEWERNRIFDELLAIVLYENCIEAGRAEVIKVDKHKRTRRRPTPLNTIEFQKLASRKLKISSQKAMDIAEKLYQRGLISYPRTETNKYNVTIDLKELASKHCGNALWGAFASEMMGDNDLYNGPLNGNGDDHAHPPIHPVKSANKFFTSKIVFYFYLEKACLMKNLKFMNL